jgi:hypothetical protein
VGDLSKVTDTTDAADGFAYLFVSVRRKKKRSNRENNTRVRVSAVSAVTVLPGDDGSQHRIAAE